MTNTEKDWRDRLEQALEVTGAKRTVISEQLGLNRDYITNILKRKFDPTIDKIEAICDAIGIQTSWLFEKEERSAAEDRIALVLSRLNEKDLEYAERLILAIRADQDL